MLIQKAVQWFRKKGEKAQSLVELALVLPIILLILLGVIEIAFLMARYLDIMDLTREAARFASIKDPQLTSTYSYTNGLYQCNRSTPFSFYYHTACIFSPPNGSPNCVQDMKFCNGLNPLVFVNEETDDVVISVYTVKGATTVELVNPPPNGYWALSDHDANLTFNGNWKKDCQGNVVNSSPHYTASVIASQLESGSPLNKGFVGVEFYYCYNQVLNIPIWNWFIPNPLRIHAYSLMPLPAAQPTPTP